MKNIGGKFGFSKTETNVILFVLIFLFIGMGAYYFKYSSEIPQQTNFDYSEEDSLFWNGNMHKEPVHRKKKVDYEQELYDFSDNELESLSKRINLNSATDSDLQKLPGIGKKTAEKIIAYRNIHQKFRSVSEIMNVKGIGEKKFEKIKKYIFIE